MKKSFKETNSIKSQSPRDMPSDGKPDWDFKCPQYDQRHSDFINAGTDYGVGINQPVGHSSKPKMQSDMLPTGIKMVDQRVIR